MVWYGGVPAFVEHKNSRWTKATVSVLVLAAVAATGLAALSTSSVMMDTSTHIHETDPVGISATNKNSPQVKTSFFKAKPSKNLQELTGTSGSLPFNIKVHNSRSYSFVVAGGDGEWDVRHVFIDSMAAAGTKTRQQFTLPQAPRNADSVDHVAYFDGEDAKCERTECPSPLPNVVALSDCSQGRAGLNDRKQVLKRVGRLAWSLCAKLIVPPPCKMMLPKHNSNHELDCKRTWADYTNYSYPDGTPVPYPVSASEYKELTSQESTTIVSVQDFPHSPTHGWHDAPKGLEEELGVAQRANKDMDPFIWRIERWFYSFDPQIPDRCPEYIRSSLLAWETLQTQRFWATLQTVSTVSARDYTFIHIRRGDMLDYSVCNTSVAAISPLLQSRKRDGLLGSGVLIASNERDPSYLRALADMLGQLVGRPGVVLMDSVLENMLPTEDNFRIFSLGQAISATATWHIDYHIHECPRVKQPYKANRD